VQEGGLDDQVKHTTEIPCTVDPREADSIDPKLPKEFKDLLGVFCTAFPNYDGTRFLWGEKGWLECHKICLVSPGRLASIDFFGVASSVQGPNKSMDYLFSQDPITNWVMTNYAPLCRETVPYGFSALLPITSSPQSVQFYVIPTSTPEELFRSVTSSSDTPVMKIDYLSTNPLNDVLVWQTFSDAGGQPTLIFWGYYKRDFVPPNPSFMTSKECSEGDYPVVNGGVSGSQPQP
jgi:hypothetical protein